MANMSYCRFRNTKIDLEDCKETLENQGLNGTDEYGEKLSRDEFYAAIELIEMAREIYEQFEDVDLDEERENYKNEL